LLVRRRMSPGPKHRPIEPPTLKKPSALSIPGRIRRTTRHTREPVRFGDRKGQTRFVSALPGGRWLAPLLFALGSLGRVSGAEAPPWEVTRGEVRIVLPLKPGGAFEGRTTALTGHLVLGSARPLALDGALEVDLATIDTGVALRNRHMRENYLELQKGRLFEKARLTELRLAEADGPEFRGRTGFTATLLVHGTPQPISGSAEIRPAGTGVRVAAEFLLSLSDFGIAPPEYFGVGVGNRIMVKVSFSAAPAAAPGGSR